MIDMAPLIHLDQIKLGDALIIDNGKTVFAAKCLEVIQLPASEIFNRERDVEILINRRKNHYFSVNRFLVRESWVKDVMVCRRMD